MGMAESLLSMRGIKCLRMVEMHALACGEMVTLETGLLDDR